MQMQYKIGLFLYVLIILSKHFTNGAPSKNQSSAYYEDDYDDYDDYYEANEADTKDFNPGNRLNSIESTMSSTRSPLDKKIEIPKRSNHVIEPTCPFACFCKEDFKYIQCSYSGLKHVPHDIPNTAIIIDLSYNNITNLDIQDFANSSKVIEINLNHNQIQDIEKDSFIGMKHLQRLSLANNKLKSLDPDTFSAANDLLSLDLSNNSIALPDKGSFLNQPNLVELICRNCSWTKLNDDSFSNMSSLTTLKLDQNNFSKKINTKAFTPLKNLIKLKLPDLDQSSIQELCSLLKSIDNISFKHFDVTCLELVLGYSFNESLILATEPTFIKPNSSDKTTSTIAPPKKVNGVQMNGVEEVTHGNLTLLSKDTLTTNEQNPNVLTADISHGSNHGNPKDIPSGEEDDKSYQVPVSEETINIMLIGIMILAVIGIIIGVICRKDIGGIKTKCCRTKKEEPKDPEQTPEEIPLNKLDKR